MIVTSNRELNIIKSGAIEIVNPEFSHAPRRQVQLEPILEEQVFVKFENQETNSHDFNISLKIAIQIILQNLPGVIKRLKICEVQTSVEKNLTSKVKEIFNTQPVVDIEYLTLQIDQVDSSFDVLLIDESVLGQRNVAKMLSFLDSDSFLIYLGNFKEIAQYDLDILFHFASSLDGTYLLRKKQEMNNCAVINIHNFEFDWLEKIKNFVSSSNYKVVYLVSQGEETSGLIGLMKCLLTEPSNVSFRCVMTDHSSKIFSLDDGFYAAQLKKNLAFNVLRNNQWGTFVHLPFDNIGKREVSHASVGLKTIGDLSTLTWIERSPNYFK